MKSLIKQIKAESSNKRNLIEEMSKTIKIEDNKNNLKIFTQKFEYQKYYFTQKKHVNHVLNLLQKENTHTNYQVGIVITHAEKIKDSFNNKLYISTITLPHTSSIIQQDPNIPIKQDIKEKKQSKAILSFIKTNAIEKWENNPNLMSKVEYEAGISHSLENNEIQNKVFISFHLNSIKSLILNNKFKIILQDYNKREIINITNQNDIDMLEKKLGSYNSKFLHNILEDKKFLDTLDYDQKEDLIEEINMIEKNVLNYNTSYLYEKKEKMDTLEKYCNLLEQF